MAAYPESDNLINAKYKKREVKRGGRVSMRAGNVKREIRVMSFRGIYTVKG